MPRDKFFFSFFFFFFFFFCLAIHRPHAGRKSPSGPPSPRAAPISVDHPGCCHARWRFCSPKAVASPALGPTPTITTIEGGGAMPARPFGQHPGKLGGYWMRSRSRAEPWLPVSPGAGHRKTSGIRQQRRGGRQFEGKRFPHEKPGPSGYNVVFGPTLRRAPGASVLLPLRDTPREENFCPRAQRD